MEQTPQTAVTTGPRAGEALSVRRLFTQAGVHPFESVECPPHHWLISFVPPEEGRGDLYRCKRCGLEKEVSRTPIAQWPPRRPPGRRRKTEE